MACTLRVRFVSRTEGQPEQPKPIMYANVGMRVVSSLGAEGGNSWEWTKFVVENWVPRESTSRFKGARKRVALLLNMVI